MWIVRLALRRTYTFVVMALLIAVLGVVSIYRMSTDIFPEINIPVVSIVWQYTGMPGDETVEIENIHRNLSMRKPIRRAILDGAAQIAVPAFVSTLAICIVFVPVVFLTGPAASMFFPMALAVVFAMLASYLWRFHQAFNRIFERLRFAYEGLLGWALDYRNVSCRVTRCPCSKRRSTPAPRAI